MTLVELTAYLESLGVEALVVQRREGAWHASVRRRTGVGPRFTDSSSMELAIRGLYIALSSEGS